MLGGLAEIAEFVRDERGKRLSSVAKDLLGHALRNEFAQ